MAPTEPQPLTKPEAVPAARLVPKSMAAAPQIIESGPYRVRPMTNSRAITIIALPVCSAGRNNARATVRANRLMTQAGMRRAPNSLSDARPMRIGPSRPASSKAVGMIAAPTLPTDGMRSYTITGPQRRMA
ncbi:hypothetical protein D9M71_549610 [compost metagenome]